MKTKSLRLKVNTAILVSCVIIAACSAAILYPVETKRHLTQLEQIKILLNAVFEQNKENIANEIFSGQEKALSMTLLSFLKVNGIIAAAAFDADGKLIETTDSSVLSERSASDLDASGNQSFFKQKTVNNLYVAEFGVPIRVAGEHFGYVKLLFDLSNMKREFFYSFVMFLLMLLTTLAAVSVFLNLFLTRMVTKPVAHLRDAIQNIQQGRLGEQIEVKAEDEIGQMAIAFNAMSQKLKEQHLKMTEAINDKEDYLQEINNVNMELAQLNSALEDRVTKRTMELIELNDQLKHNIEEIENAAMENKGLQERLLRSQKMEALGLLAGGVAHDLNNVLSGIVSYPDLLLMDIPSDSPLRKPILTIQSSGYKAAAIVQDLLTLARRGVTNLRVMNLNTIVMEYLNSPEHEKLMYHNRDIQVITSLHPQLLNIKGSEIHLKKTVMNLVSNAAEAQPEGGKIIISTENRYLDVVLKGYENVKEGDYVVLSIEDTGTGILPQDLSRIFEPFYSKKVMGRSGTGLGMAVVWGTVQDHQGYINVETAEGKGSTFELFLPVSREGLTLTDKLVQIEDYMGKGESILVVDDVPEQREIASGILSKLNYSVSVASSGEDAVSYLKTHSADLIILDMIMEPGIDGLETYRRIIQIHPGQRAVIASGFAENKRVKEIQNLGAGQYIRKPYTIEKIGLAVKKELEI